MNDFGCWMRIGARSQFQAWWLSGDEFIEFMTTTNLCRGY